MNKKQIPKHEAYFWCRVTRILCLAVW